MTAMFTPAVGEFAQAIRCPTPAGLPRRVHLVGIGGSGMKALAELLEGFGVEVSGSDQALAPETQMRLRLRGLRVHQGHDAAHIGDDVDCLVYSSAVGPNNPERRWAQKRGIPQFAYHEMLGRLMREKQGVVIAGTHGKSTTTAMTAQILRDAGMSPSAVVGAELVGFNAGGFAGEGPLFVVEGCEYQRHFLAFEPTLAVILSIEPDHFDYYDDFRETCAAFAEFAGQVRRDGVLLVRGDCEISRRVARSARSAVETFALSPGADWWAADLRTTCEGQRFRVFHRRRFVTELFLPMAGRHNVLNALAAFALARHAGAASHQIRESLREFRGIRRRFELLGSWRGVTLVDDYAHHPTAVRATLETVRERFPRRRVWCAFQPHQVSRTRKLLTDFGRSLALADEVLVAPALPVREEATQQAAAVSRTLAHRTAQEGARARFCESLDRIVATVEDEAAAGDVLVTMGAGDIDRVAHEFTRRVQRHSPPR